MLNFFDMPLNCACAKRIENFSDYIVCTSYNSQDDIMQITKALQYSI